MRACRGSGADIVTRMPVRLRLSHLDGPGLAVFCAENGRLRPEEEGFYVRVSLIEAPRATADLGRPDVIKHRTPFEGPVFATDFAGHGDDGPAERISAIMTRLTTAADGTSSGVDDGHILQLEVKSRRVADLKLLDLPGAASWRGER